LPSAVQDVTVSIIIPVRDFASGVGACVDAALAQVPPACEIIVSDDGSVDGSGDVARARGVRVIRSEVSRGPSAARNDAVKVSRGEILLFVDSDCVAQPTALATVVEAIVGPGGPDAVFGSYDDDPSEPSRISQFRNLLHHYTHQRGESEASTFWTGCGAIRREAFDAVDGFDPNWDGIEDIEFGYRLRAAGFRVELIHALQVQHLKLWTLRSMLATDFSLRAVKWARLIRETGVAADDLNISLGQRLSVAFSATAAVAFAVSVVKPVALAVAVAALLLVGLLNRDFYVFLASRRGIGFVIAIFPFHICYFLTAGSGFAFALIRSWFSSWSAK
jgi:glycosyltransferase involved in cell wall biosynthesis